MNTIDTVARVLCIVGFVSVCLAFWQHRWLERFLIARASKPISNPWARFWRGTILGAVVSALLPAFAERCTGFHLPLRLSLLPSIIAFAIFVGALAHMYFVAPRRYARDPRRSLRTSFVCIGLAGFLFLAAIYMDFAR